MARSTLQLHTERLVLLLPDPRDAQRVLDYCSRNRAHLSAWEPVRPSEYFTRTFWDRQLAAAQDEFARGESVRLVLLRREDPTGPVIGVVNLSQIVRGAFQAGVLGYSLDEQCQGHGFMTEALRAVVQHAFRALRLHRVMANYRPENERSGRVLDTLGFVREGYAASYLFIDGAWRDHVLTALVNPEGGDPGAVLPHIRPT